MNPETVVFHMHSTVGTLATVLGWKPEEGSYDVPLTRTAAYLNVPSVGDYPADKAHILLAVAEMEVWRYAMNTTASFHTFSTADGESRQRGQIHENAREMFRMAESRVGELTGTYVVQVRTLDQQRSPYSRPRDMLPTERWNWWDRR